MENCVHHWHIETPNGTPYCKGTCIKCGATRDDFAASFEEALAQVARRDKYGKKRAFTDQVFDRTRRVKLEVLGVRDPSHALREEGIQDSVL